MENDLTKGKDALANIPAGLQFLGDYSAAQLMECNGTTGVFGLVLSPADVQFLAETRADALGRMGRVEFGECATRKIILEFCDSPYLSQDTFAETVGELAQLFYYFKSELEWMADSDLIARMKAYFDTECRGSTEDLAGALENMTHCLKYGDFSCGADAPEEDEYE